MIHRFLITIFSFLIKEEQKAQYGSAKTDVEAPVVVLGRRQPRQPVTDTKRFYRGVKFVLFDVFLFYSLVGMFMSIYTDNLPTYAVRRGMSPALAGYLPAAVL
ncbi:hypothetical protein MY4824_007852 [Beauveria thailandica]